MNTLIIKLGATGDVIRTTSLLNVLKGQIDWVTEDRNVEFLNGLSQLNNIIKKSEIKNFNFPRYDLVINLEDSIECGELLRTIKFKNLFGAYLTDSNKLSYTESSAKWFDLSLISKYGLDRANELKYQNTKSFQELVFEGMGYNFNGENYILPSYNNDLLKGDIAISPKAGNVWPMKNWYYYKELARILTSDGYTVNYLPQRKTMLEHLADIKNHKLLISGDSLPMHLALGTKVKCVSLFICTSPNEIYDYNILKKILSKDLKKYFYRRDFDVNATKSISIEEVYTKVVHQLKQIPTKALRSVG